jgi:hypothetical protein
MNQAFILVLPTLFVKCSLCKVHTAFSLFALQSHGKVLAHAQRQRQRLSTDAFKIFLTPQQCPPRLQPAPLLTGLADWWGCTEAAAAWPSCYSWHYVHPDSPCPSRGAAQPGQRLVTCCGWSFWSCAWRSSSTWSRPPPRRRHCRGRWAHSSGRPWHRHHRHRVTGRGWSSLG